MFQFLFAHYGENKGGPKNKGFGILLRFFKKIPKIFNAIKQKSTNRYFIYNENCQCLSKMQIFQHKWWSTWLTKRTNLMKIFREVSFFYKIGVYYMLYILNFWGFTKREIMANAMLVILAGHETTASVMQFILFILVKVFLQKKAVCFQILCTLLRWFFKWNVYLCTWFLVRWNTIFFTVRRRTLNLKNYLKTWLTFGKTL